MRKKQKLRNFTRNYKKFRDFLILVYRTEEYHIDLLFEVKLILAVRISTPICIVLIFCFNHCMYADVRMFS